MPVGIHVGHFLDCQLMWEILIYCQWCHPWARELGMYDSSWWSQRKQARKRHSFTGFCSKLLLWLLALASYDYGLTIARRLKQTLSSTDWCWSVFYHGNRMQTNPTGIIISETKKIRINYTWEVNMAMSLCLTPSRLKEKCSEIIVCELINHVLSLAGCSCHLVCHLLCHTAQPRTAAAPLEVFFIYKDLCAERGRSFILPQRRISRRPSEKQN